MTIVLVVGVELGGPSLAEVAKGWILKKGGVGTGRLVSNIATQYIIT